MAEPRDAPALKIEDLQVYYGESHAIQGVSMTIDHGVLAVVVETAWERARCATPLRA